jgi:hypothetical protein
VANKRTKRPTLHSFLELEAELNELSGKSGLNEEATSQQLTSNFAPNFTTFLNQRMVTVFDPNIDNVSIYDSVLFVTPVSVGGLVLSGNYSLTPAHGGRSYEINALSNAAASVSNGGAVPVFTTTDNDPVVRVTLDNYSNAMVCVDSLAGDFRPAIRWEQVATTGNGVTISGSYEVTVVDDNNFNNQAATQATASGSFAMNGGNVQLVYYIRRIGPDERIIGQIKEICSQLPFAPVCFGAESRPYAEWFCEKLRWRLKSSGHWLDYSIERGRLLGYFGEIHVKKQIQNLKEEARQRHQAKAGRNIDLAQEFLRIRGNDSRASDSALKERIGWKAHHLRRSAAIAAVDDGLRRLGKR